MSVSQLLKELWRIWHPKFRGIRGSKPWNIKGAATRRAGSRRRAERRSRERENTLGWCVCCHVSVVDKCKRKPVAERQKPKGRKPRALACLPKWRSRITPHFQEDTTTSSFNDKTLPCHWTHDDDNQTAVNRALKRSQIKRLCINQSKVLASMKATRTFKQSPPTNRELLSSCFLEKASCTVLLPPKSTMKLGQQIQGRTRVFTRALHTSASKAFKDLAWKERGDAETTAHDFY